VPESSVAPALAVYRDELSTASAILNRAHGQIVPSPRQHSPSVRPSEVPTHCLCRSAYPKLRLSIALPTRTIKIPIHHRFDFCVVVSTRLLGYSGSFLSYSKLPLTSFLVLQNLPRLKAFSRLAITKPCSSPPKTALRVTLGRVTASRALARAPSPTIKAIKTGSKLPSQSVPRTTQCNQKPYV
jgi:hypothetical protein